MRDQYSKTDLRVYQSCEYVLQGDQVPCNWLKGKLPRCLYVYPVSFFLAHSTMLTSLVFD